MGPSYPHRIGRYVLFDEIASGGMATVHMGRLDAAGGFKRTVAIKRLHRQYGENPEFVAMLLDEARITARIQHPNVVPVLDIVSADRELLLVMDYVHGESLSQLLKIAKARGERPSPKIVAHIMSSVLSGLHAAHTCTGDDGVPLKVVHRDVSPQNVIIGHDGVARLIDFGIARAEQRTRGITRDGSVRGKISYMAPEQLGEDPAAIDCRADVYAAAQMCWEAFTGELLFNDTLPVVVAKKLTNERIAPASTLVPDLPAGLDAIIAKGLAMKPEDRWQSAEAMATAIEEAVPPATAREIGAWVNKLAGDRLASRSVLVSRTKEDRLAAEATPLPLRESSPSHPNLGLGAGLSDDALTAVASSSGPLPEARVVGPGDVASAGPITLTNPQDVVRSLPVHSSKRPILMGVLLAIGCAGVFLIATSIMDRQKRSTANANANATTATSPTMRAATAAAATPVSASPNPTSSSINAISPSSTASNTALTDTPTPSPPPSATTAKTTGATTTTATTPQSKGVGVAKNPCDPPWRIDERGVRVLKRECFK